MASLCERFASYLPNQVTALKEEVSSLQALLLQERVRGTVDEQRGRGRGPNEDDEIIDLSS